MKRSAFTLIELLVVIAIIAILAAILFPVFAQAKAAAKAAANLSSTKQMGTAVNIYLTDSDDTMPLAAVLRPANGRLGTGVGIPFPYNNGLENTATAAGLWKTAGRMNMSQCTWHNALLPYTKNTGIYAFTGNKQSLMFAGGTSGTDSFTTGPGIVAPADAALTYNGDMHRYNATAIPAPSSAVLLWPGNGGTNFHGRDVADPALNCGNTIEDCIFSPGAVPSAVTYAGGGIVPTNYGDIFFDGPVYNNFFFQANHRMPVVHVDSSAKATPVCSAIIPNVDAFSSAYVEPFAQMNSNGGTDGLIGFYGCDVNGKVVPFTDTTTLQYWCFFRPDRTQ